MNKKKFYYGGENGKQYGIQEDSIDSWSLDKKEN